MERITPFGKYYLLERINVGGMAEVFKAKTIGVEGFEKIVAIKRILPAVAEDEDFIKMFIDEAKITSQLSHANLAQTFDLGKIFDTYYIAMEFVPGKDLRAVFERLKRRSEKLPLPLAAFIVWQLCEGLDYAHRKRDPAGQPLHIVHRDVSPQNVILSFEGEVKLIDFGIAKAASKITQTHAGILKGKFGYMSPEQVRGLPLDGRSDLFSAGVVLYELCTGERVFSGSSDFSVLEKVQQAEIRPPRALSADLPERLEKIILRALAREPEDRYQHAAELAADLRQFLATSGARPATREDLAAFMKSTFPDEDPRQSMPALEPTRLNPTGRPPSEPPASRRRPERELLADTPATPLRPPRGSQPPPLPASLTADLAAATQDWHDEATVQMTIVEEGPAEDGLGGGAMGPGRSRNPPPVPSEAVPERSEPASPAWTSNVEVQQEPTRPMSMAELAAAEREYAQRKKNPSTPPSPPPSLELLADELRRQDLPLPSPGALLTSAPPPVASAPSSSRTDKTVSVRRPGGFDPTGAAEDGSAPPAQPSRPPGPVADDAAAQPPRLRTVVLGVGALAGIAALLTLFFWGAPHAASTRLGTAAKDPASAPAPTAAPVASGAASSWTVFSAPPGARVYVDGEARGVTPAFVPGVDPARPHAISVEKRCFRPWQVGVPAQAGRRELVATLQASPGPCGRAEAAAPERETSEMPEAAQSALATLGFLTLTSRPQASVFIDGVDIGRPTPLVMLPLRAGNHRIALGQGGNLQRLDVAIRGGETHAQFVDLRPGRGP